MRKPDEIALYAALRAHDRERGRSVGGGGCGYELPALAARLGIPEKRAWTLLAKWSDRGWWNYGVSLRGGWFEPGAPEALTP